MSPPKKRRATPDLGVLVRTPTAPEPVGVELRQFSVFFCAKAFDIISDNRYRKHTVRCKELGDTWAVEVQESVVSVMSCVREIHQAIERLQNCRHANILRLCRDVLNNSTPPIRTRDGWCTCSITGIRAERCIEVFKPSSRSGGKACNSSTSWRTPGTATPKNHAHASGAPGRDSIIHPKFGHFALMLWYVCKIEHIVRNFTRCWLEDQPCDQPVSSLCKAFESNTDVFQRCHAVFLHAYHHVVRSIQNHLDLPGPD